MLTCSERSEAARPILSLVTLRAMGPKGSSGDALRSYVLGIALVAMTHDRPHDLRQGCLLVRDQEKKSVWELVWHDGTRELVAAQADTALAFAQEAATAFVVGESRPAEFDRGAANEKLKEQVGGSQKKKKGS
jgi:CRISPR-associated protein Csb1